MADAELMTPTPRQPRFVRWALTLGIVVILNVLFAVVISLAVPTPQLADYCPTPTTTPADAASCDAAGGVWTESSTLTQPSGYCDLYGKCQGPLTSAMDKQALYSFAILVGLGILSILVGFAPLGSSAISSGFSYGGVVALVIASVAYWGTADNWVRLVIALAALIALLAAGWRRFRD